MLGSWEREILCCDYICFLRKIFAVWHQIYTMHCVPSSLHDPKLRRNITAECLPQTVVEGNHVYILLSLNGPESVSRTKVKNNVHNTERSILLYCRWTSQVHVPSTWIVCMLWKHTTTCMEEHSEHAYASAQVRPQQRWTSLRRTVMGQLLLMQRTASYNSYCCSSSIY